MELLVGLDAPEQHRELLAAPPRQAVVRSEGALQPPRELHQHGIADQVPVGVVDVLEVVGVEQEQPAAVRSIGERRVGDLAEVTPVERARELVGAGAEVGLLAGLLHLVMRLADLGHAAQQVVLESPPRRDVAADAVVEERAVGVAPRPKPLRDDALEAVEATNAVLEVDRLARAGRVDGRSPALAIIRVHKSLVRPVVVAGLAELSADERLAVRAAVDRASAAVRIDAKREEVGIHRVHHLREGRVRLRELGAHPPALGDVGDDPADLGRSVWLTVGDRAVVHPARDPVGPAQPVFDVCALARCERGDERVVRRTVVGVEGCVPVLHCAIGLGASEHPVRAGALEQLLQPAVGMGQRQIDVLADHVEQPRDAVTGDPKPRGDLVARCDI
jgi:hypothetical protein